MNARILRLCLWTGPALVVMFAIGMVALAGIIPPTDPDDSALQIAQFFRDDEDSIRVGLSIGIVAMALIAPFGIAIASMVRGGERGTPVLTYIQIACVGVGTSVAVIMCLVWGTASFRPDELAPDTTRMLNDLAWFFFLFSFAPFSVWLVALGLAIMGDERIDAPFPRWVAYLNFWLALLFVPAVLMIFFKSGAFSYNGVITFWVPTLAFFGWVSSMAVLGLRALRRADQRSPTVLANETDSDARFANSESPPTVPVKLPSTT